MGDPFEEELEVPPAVECILEAPLPSSIEAMLRKICSEQCQEPPDAGIRRRLGSIGEQGSLAILRIISTRAIRKTLSAFLVYLMDRYPDCLSSSPFASPQKRTSPSLLPTPESKRVQGESSSKPKPKIGSSPCVQFASPQRVIRQLSFGDEPSPESNCRTPSLNISQQLMILGELEFRKLFLVLSYIGSKKLEDVISPKIADDIVRKKTLPMTDFESEIWNAFGKACYTESDRSKYLDWDCGKTHLYYCHIKQNGYCTFKGPYLNTTRTHLQRALGDENVLIVKFVEDACCANIIVEEGILVGFRRYRFFVYKDDKERKKTPAIMKTKTASLKCYFVRFESIETYNHGGSYVFAGRRTSEARCHFMHVHMVSNMAKYAARLSLILSKTIKLQVNLASVTIERVEDILCRDESGCIICDEDGEPCIHTDGTGFISEDLAMRCPKDFSKAEYIKDENYENFVDIVDLEDMIAERRGNGSLNKEPPLLMQCRLYKNGCAVKGTFLINRKIGSRKIQIRPSMVKVETDPTISSLPTFNSLEVVAIRPRKTYLSKHLISLLSYGGVGREFFMEILGSALEETKQVYLKKRAALKVAINYREMDDDCLAARMISSGVPLNEPHLHARLSRLAKIERSKLRGGKLPLSDSFYLMGTADPTGVLENNEVCVILDSGQVSGRVLVYRNPGLHFGDVHVMKARYVEELVDIVGDAKYGIVFSTKGPRSAASEIANGDFDGDMYWVSINRKLVDSYRASKPWTRTHSTPKAVSKKPTEFSADELEYELFRQFLRAKSKGASMSVAADSWLAFMDRLLMLRDDDADGMHSLKGKMLHLIDIYYDALDAPKSGKKVSIPHDLKANRFPHYMERGNPFSYHSTSILGQIYDYVDSYPDEDLCITEISKLPCFDVEIPDECTTLWRERYEEYKKDMTMAMNSGCEVKNSACNEVIKKYKKLLYGAPEFEQSVRKTEDIFNEALALYHVTYDNARITYSIEKCGFAWKVAGSALCRIHAMYQKENAFPILPSILQDIL
ncbi:probable RNA-dependent RNA polymerase 3 isoform X2 [Nicotiana sylvestris]|uniref:RNA-dependent RNA polymerase n=1 Tax=Nicotiana sylvestris TaxID=4096 RepID=A0A1U7X0S6_NICSY|nr:PREDICTED: probable RNA-dependent RNA polymerase 3 isoform X2 [Nicotiana sylvestris]XP_016454733.1 PREDICTED: probable RNA-dependent RNA polymerase 3 isoform X2 [Nicotiana tabacum]